MKTKTIKLTFTEVCALGEVLEFVLEGLEECDDRYITISDVLTKVDADS